MGNWRINLEIDQEPHYLQAVWRLDSITRLIQQALPKYMNRHDSLEIVIVKYNISALMVAIA